MNKEQRKMHNVKGCNSQQRHVMHIFSHPEYNNRFYKAKISWKGEINKKSKLEHFISRFSFTTNTIGIKGKFIIFMSF